MKPKELQPLDSGERVYHAKVKGTVGGRKVIEADVWVVRDKGKDTGHLWMSEPPGLRSKDALSGKGGSPTKTKMASDTGEPPEARPRAEERPAEGTPGSRLEESRAPDVESAPATTSDETPSVPGSRGRNTTRTGLRRNNPRDWRSIRKSWDEAGYGDALSPENRIRIDNGRTPIVDDHWIEWFPGDANLRGEKISIHHIKGGVLNIPLPKSRHRDAHMPGGTSTNPGGPGTTGAIEKEDDGTRIA